MAKNKAEMMKAMRDRRREAGLVEFRVWVTPANKDKIQDFVASNIKATIPVA